MSRQSESEGPEGDWACGGGGLALRGSAGTRPRRSWGAAAREGLAVMALSVRARGGERGGDREKEKRKNGE